MKSFITISLLLISITLKAQFKVNYSKSERKKITFHQEKTDTKTHYYFLLDGIKTGPSIILRNTRLDFFQYDKKGGLQGTFVTIRSNEIEIGTYKDGVIHGNSFTTENITEVSEVLVYKDGRIKKDLTQKYLSNTTPIRSDIGRGERNGFSNWSDGEVQQIGWWKLPYVTSPALEYDFEDKTLYIGDFNKKGNKNGFGFYKFKNGKIDVGYTKKGDDHGLVITIDKNGKPLFAGHFTKGYYTDVYLDNQDK